MNCEPVVLNATHLDDIIRIAEESFSIRWGRQDFAYFLSHDSGMCLGSRLPDRTIVGYLIGLLVAGELDIISIATSSEHRRQGIAEDLIRRAQWEPRVTQITLEVDTTNLPAVGLYKKLGFKVTGTRKAYYQQKQDAYRMLWRDEGAG